MHLCGPRGLTKAREDVRVGFMDALQFEVQTLCAFCVGLPMPQACALLCGHRVGLVSGTNVMFRCFCL